ncbi:hypothetical protein [Aridibaculum aurantiacum]|uniref:hypothetical protein n=1 Tax=Aridibaculum aurantiacum TaxID=2810307 RepID=UPI001A9792DC|nr:hypothetical protein [Aridibaculum aurantiacum]
MKRLLIGALVGAILIFGWQGAARMVFKYHYEGLKPAPNSDAILATLSSNLPADGQYYLPDLNPDATPEDMENFEKQHHGKPWAIINFHRSYDSRQMGMLMTRQFTTMFLSVLLFIWIVGKNPGSFSSVFFKSIAAGIFVFVTAWYPQNIWWELPWPVLRGELIDLLVGWALAGLWLGWWLNRRTSRR